MPNFRERKMMFISICIATVCLLFWSVFISKNHLVPKFLKRNDCNHLIEINYWSEQRTFRQISQIANDLNNYHLYFRSLVKGSRYESHGSTIRDGFVSINAPIQRLTRLFGSERKNKLEEVSSTIKTKIYRLQNPHECKNTKLLVYSISQQRCGFGCVLHSITSNLALSLATNRTLVLQSRRWQYARRGWEHLFLPLSSCQYNGDVTALKELSDPDDDGDELVVKGTSEPGNWIFWTIPKEIVENLNEIQDGLFAWWMGQFTVYAMRFQTWFERKVLTMKPNIRNLKEIVGIHIRWGDKVQLEAKKYPIEEYMYFVETWYNQLDSINNAPVARVVYLATEEPGVWIDLRRKYPKYEFIGSGSKFSSGDANDRYDHAGLESVVKDIYFLSKCGYLVCTLSSSVCRAAYELKLAQNADTGTNFQSIDALYRLKQSNSQPWIAVMNHKPQETEELDLREGDEIVISLDPHLPFNDGFLRGKNTRTGLQGKFPIFKARERIPTYNDSVIFRTMINAS